MRVEWLDVPRDWDTAEGHDERVEDGGDCQEELRRVACAGSKEAVRTRRGARIIARVPSRPVSATVFLPPSPQNRAYPPVCVAHRPDVESAHRTREVKRTPEHGRARVRGGLSVSPFDRRDICSLADGNVGVDCREAVLRVRLSTLQVIGWSSKNL